MEEVEEEMSRSIGSSKERWKKSGRNDKAVEAKEDDEEKERLSRAEKKRRTKKNISKQEKKKKRGS